MADQTVNTEPTATKRARVEEPDATAVDEEEPTDEQIQDELSAKLQKFYPVSRVDEYFGDETGNKLWTILRMLADGTVLTSDELQKPMMLVLDVPELTATRLGADKSHIISKYHYKGLEVSFKNRLHILLASRSLACDSGSAVSLKSGEFVTRKRTNICVEDDRYYWYTGSSNISLTHHKAPQLLEAAWVHIKPNIASLSADQMKILLKLLISTVSTADKAAEEPKWQALLLAELEKTPEELFKTATMPRPEMTFAGAVTLLRLISSIHAKMSTLAEVVGIVTGMDAPSVSSLLAFAQVFYCPLTPLTNLTLLNTSGDTIKPVLLSSLPGADAVLTGLKPATANQIISFGREADPLVYPAQRDGVFKRKSGKGKKSNQKVEYTVKTEKVSTLTAIHVLVKKENTGAVIVEAPAEKIAAAVAGSLF